MPDIKILTETELRKLVPLDMSAIDCVEAGFAALSAGTVEMPPILSLDVHENNGEVDVKTAHIQGAESFTIKMSPGFYDNPKIGLPTTNGIMVVFSAKTGQVEALLLDNGYLTETRTAAAGAVAARHLARQDASRLCVVGAGAQARLQVTAINQVRPLTHVDVWARDSEKAEKAAEDIAAMLGIETSFTHQIEDAVCAADIIVTTTPAKEPLIFADWLTTGQLVIAMGSDQEGKFELEPALIARADYYIPDRLAQTRVLGEARAAIDAGVIASDADFPELGDVVAGKLPEYDAADSLTVCDLTGTGVQDAAIATLARQRAEAAGRGATFTS
ncbi:L-lysine cyclodeaminase [Roseovarius albus]|uniref:L-lysine cyclodeaminase n=1 Tax=Roseovarius albus TaxID=1247867 RepID=A0A1X6ZNM3_9RHOB|nr:cyclodeaminase [Roseovarius albus]SLN56386.1 L-lysine cyclodeaminase [Roseovarius albus]